MCRPMFTATLFIIAKTLKQPECPPAEERTKMWYIYTVEYYSALKKDEIMPCEAPWMELESVTLSEVSQRRRNILRHPLYVESKKK